MLSIKNLKVSTRLRLLVGAAVVGLVALAVASYFTIEKLKVGGSIDAEMTVYADLAGNVVPPALDIERVRYGVLKMLAENQESLSANITLYEERKKTYVEANADWNKRLPEGKIKDLIEVQAYDQGRQYLQAIDNELIPALKRGDRKTADEVRQRAGTVVTKCLEATGQAADLITAQQKELDQSASKSVLVSTLVLMGVCVLVSIVIGLLGLAIGRGVTTGTDAAVRLAKSIATGNLQKSDGELGKDEFGDLLGAMNQSIDAINALLTGMDHMSTQHDLGEIDVFVKAEDFKGAYQSMAAGLNRMVQGHISVKKKAMACIAEFSKGNFDAPLERFPGKKAFINENIEGLRTNLKQVSNEVGELIEATLQGKLATRAHTDGVHGDWKKLVGSINALIEAFVKPINVTADYIDKIGKGNIPPKITDTYNGDFNLIKNNLNACIDNVNALVNDAAILAQAAVEGKLSTRADASKHGGDFRKIVEGVNHTLDAVIGPLNVAARYVDEISHGLVEASDILQAMAANDYTQRLSGSSKRVKITDTYNGDFNTIKNNLNACIEALEGVGIATNKTADTVEASMKSIAQNAQALSSSSQQLSATSQQMSGNAEETSAQASTVATATQQVTTNLNSVATGAEEMTSTVQSISSNASEAAKVAGEAVKTANSANTTIAKLGESSAEVGQVIKVITSIAQQTNLLALNATIEAARAGEAGKGFAVVANEVKELAKQTAKATEDISQKITAIQEDTKRAVDSIGSITAVINQINDISSTIATAVEEQSATTNEMSRNVQEAAKGSGEISHNIQGVASAAESTTRGAQDTLQAAQQLTAMAVQLRSLVEQFKLSDSGTSAASPAMRSQAKAQAARA